MSSKKKRLQRVGGGMLSGCMCTIVRKIGKGKRQKLLAVEVNTMDSLLAGRTYYVINAKSEITENNIQEEYSVLSFKFLTSEFLNSVKRKRKRFYFVKGTCWLSLFFKLIITFNLW